MKRRITSLYCTSDSMGASVVRLLILGHRRSKAPLVALSPPFHASINHQISVWLRCHFLVPLSSPCLSKLCLFLLSDGSEQNSVCVQRETISSVYQCVCLRARLRGRVYQCEKSRHSRPPQNKLINWPFVRAETGPNKREREREKKRIETFEMIARERKWAKDSKQRQKTFVWA